MNPKRTTGPWKAFRASKPQPSGDWYVARNVSIRPSFSHFEQMRDQDGQIVMFETEALANEAISTRGAA